MYKKILTAVNEHLNSEIAARYALHFAKNTGAKIYICSIAERGMSQQSICATEMTVKRLFNEAINMNLQAESIIETGDPVHEIGEIIRLEGISIAFASTRREDIRKRFFAGTIARRLLLKLPCSVALVRVIHSGRIHPKKLLVPLKARIDHVVERASFVAHMAGAFSSKVFVFHAPEPPTKFFHGELHLTPPEWDERRSHDLVHFMEYLKKHEIEHEGKLLPGRTAKNITIEAFAKRHDLIIMGASERSLLQSLMKGNPVEEVLRETPCDLIIFKPAHED